MLQIKKKILYPELSYRITGICFKVHRELGRFNRETQYSDNLEEALKKNGITYKREYEIAAGNKVDFLINDEIILDVKAKKFILKDDYFQMQRYLQSSGKELGLIINFRNVYLKPKRVLNTKLFG